MHILSEVGLTKMHLRRRTSALIRPTISQYQREDDLTLDQPPRRVRMNGGEDLHATGTLAFGRMPTCCLKKWILSPTIV